MTPALTVKSQVTIPKAIREFLGIAPGMRIKFEPLADGRVAIAPALSADALARRLKCPFEALAGSAGPGLSTDELMKMTRGGDWNQA